ncbi:hypothetical protein BH09PSE3_BH09PSE3_12050 [soil metagenome]
MRTATPILIAFGFISAAPAASLTIDQMQGNRRVLIITAPGASDARLIEQRRILTKWKQGADERDVSVVEVIDDQVHGAGDNASKLRRLRHLPLHRFAVVLIGKDGHEAVRSKEPLTGKALSDRIDAMPMRRAGRR